MVPFFDPPCTFYERHSCLRLWAFII